MDAFSDLNLVGYLYNSCYGGFGFSEEFQTKLNERRVAAGKEPIEYFREERTDPMYIELFNELGSKRSSDWAARLTMRYFPEAFLKYVLVNEYDGRESPSIVYSEIYEDLMKGFFSEREKNPELTLEELEQRYKTMNAMIARYKEYLDFCYKNPSLGDSD